MGNDARARRIRRFVEEHKELFLADSTTQLYLTDKFCPFVIATLNSFRRDLLTGLPKTS
jgi:hypothetical protein